MTSSKDYTDRVCIVTGSSSGIGACTVKKLAEYGAKVVVTGRDAVRIAQVADECKQLSPNGYEPLQVVCDLTKSDDIRRLVQSTIDRFEKIDLVAANAGVFSSALIDNPKLVETFDFTMLTNVRPVLRLLQLCVPYLEQSKGAIVVTSSMLSFKPIAIYMPYCMSKAALDIMTKCLAIDLGPKGIRVNSVNPAIVNNNFIARSLGLDFDQMSIELNKAGQSYPLGRLATVDDIANLILFLGSEDAAFITGQNICPDGGSTFAGDSEVN